MTIFVTGATGFLGRHLVRALKAEGFGVSTLLRPWSYESIRQQFYARSPDVVIHLAAYYRADHQPADLSPMIVANIGLITHVCEAMRARALTHLITIGTAWQDFNGRPGVPANLYAATKSAADAMVDYYVDAHDFRVVNLRLINLYGPEDTRKTLLTQLHDGMTLTAGQQETAFVRVDDAVAAIRSALDRVESMRPGRQTYAVWGTPKPLRETITAMYPTLTLQWGAVPYRPREMMQLPTHLPTLLPQGVLT